ncbi:MAG: serine hydrolase [Flavobacteriaceae bacterium]|nr:serine hydrolase [Flavobacteriaceae bacterium]
MLSNKYLLFLLFFHCVAFTNAQSDVFTKVKPEMVGLSTDSLQKMNAHFHRLVDDGKLAGIQTAILRHGQLAQFDSYGYANLAEATPLDEGSLFRIFSMTKPIVSVALMQLYEQGKFKLDDPLYKFIPEFREMKVFSEKGLVKAKIPIRIIDLLRHSSGYTYGRSALPEMDRMYREAHVHASTTNREFVLKLSRLPLYFEPGTDWRYGFSTNICGYLIEVLSGKDLDRYLKEHILTPLNMHDTHFQVPQDKVDRFTVGYRWQEGSGLQRSEAQRNNRYTRKVTLFNGGGGMVSTTNDYLRFCQMLLNKGEGNGQRILKEATVALMLQDQLQEVRPYQERLRLPMGESGFGLGFAIRGSDANHLERVYGWGGAVGTYFKIDLEHDMAYVMMIQLAPHRHLGLRQLIQDYIEAALVP